MNKLTLKVTEIKNNPNNPRLIKDDKLFVCGTCDSRFTSKKACATRTPKYCSKSCYAQSLIIDKTKVCKSCGVSFETYKHEQKYCSLACASVIHRGENSHWWKGGITEENESARKSKDYKKWRESVFMRDEYTCQICYKKGVKLHADHIKPFAYFVEQRFDINNGRTLCVDCHYKTDTYGSKALKYAS